MLKVLTAVAQPVNPEPTDFSFAVDGELVVLNPMVCDSGSCGCERAAIGLGSRRATTTVMVSERDMTVDDIARGLASLKSSWGGMFDEGDCDAFWAEAINVAGSFPTGTVLRFLAEPDHWVMRAETVPTP